MRKTVIAAGVATALAAGAAIALAPAAGASVATNKVTYTVSKDGSIKGPHTLHPGYSQIKIAGAKGHGFQLVHPRSGSTKSTLLKDSAAVNNGKPRPLETDFGILGGTSTGSTMYRDMAAGRYYAVDVDNPKPTSKDVIVITVKGATVNSPRTPLDGRLTAIHAMRFSTRPASMPHKGVLRFENKATDWHFLELDQLKKGKTKADVKKALDGQESFNEVFTGVSYDDGVVAPGTREVTSYNLPKGNYAMICFWPDKMNGVPHAFMGMYRTIALV